MGNFLRLAVMLAAVLWWTAAPALAKEGVHIGELSDVDRQFMAQQRELLNDLVARNYGGRFNGVKDNDLGLLQRLLDQQLVRNDQTRELQAMGVIMGDLLAAEYALDWVVYEDRLGRSRALRYQQTDNYLFPITMISRLREVDNRTPVPEIYRRAQEAITPVIAPLPFQ